VSDLIEADLLDFVQRNLVVAETDLARFGALLLPRDKLERVAARPPDYRYMPRGATAKDYWSRHASYLYLLTRAVRDADLLGGEEWAIRVCQEAPAQIRGYFKELQAKEQASLPKRSNRGPKPKLRFSNYELGKIIKKRRITPVPL
jgi:hypothetical protein